MWHINTVEYYLAMNKKEIRAFITTQMNLKDIILSTIRQTQKDKYCILLLIGRIKNDQTHRNGGKMGLPWRSVFKTLFTCRGWEFDPWSGINLYATQCGQKQTNKKDERTGHDLATEQQQHGKQYRGPSKN